MEPLSDDHIAHLLRLKRYEQPPPGYFENFLHEFHRRQREREELCCQPFWRVCLERAEGFALRLDVRSLAPAGIAVLVAGAALFAIRLYQQPTTTHVAIQESPVPSAPSNSENELNLAPPVLNATFDMQPTPRSRSRDVRLLPGDSLPPGEFIPFDLEWESLDDQSLLPGTPR